MANLLELAKKYETIERRREDRLACDFKAQLTVLSIPSGTTPTKVLFRGMASNISLAGTRIAIATYADLEAGAIVRIKLTCGLLKTFTFVGTLRSVKRDVREPVFFASFEITGSSAHTMKAWHKFIAQQILAQKSRPGATP